MATDAVVVPARDAHSSRRELPRRLRSESSPVVLAHENIIELGPLTIEPSLRRLSHTDSRHEVLQPRVMQVLVALASCPEAILTRQELTERCWSGRSVGEDAINRVLSRLRALSAGIAKGVFRVETITKVGYRLMPECGVRHLSSASSSTFDALESAYVIITFEPGSRCADVVPKLKQIPLIAMIHGLAGPLDLLVRLEGPSIADIETSREMIAAVEGVATAATYVVLSRHFE